MENPKDDLSRAIRRGEAWALEEDKRLYDCFAAKQPIASLASEHGRTGGAIRSRLRCLGLRDVHGNRVEPTPEFIRVIKRKPQERSANQVVAATLSYMLSLATSDGLKIKVISNCAFTASTVEALVPLLREAIDSI